MSPYSEGVERDIAGKAIVRDTANMPKRLSRDFLQKYPRCSFAVYSADETAADLERARRRKISGRTAKSRDANRRFLDRYIVELETRLRLAEEYEAETSRIVEQSGIKDVKFRVKKAERAAALSANAVASAPAITMGGIRLKAEVLVSEMERLFDAMPTDTIFNNGYRLARAILSHT